MSSISRSDFVSSMISLLKEEDEDKSKKISVEDVMEELTYDYPRLDVDRLNVVNAELTRFLKGKSKTFRPSPNFFKGVAYVVKHQTASVEIAKLATFCFVHVFLKFLRDEIFVPSKDECTRVMKEESSDIPGRLWMCLQDRDWVQLDLCRNMMDLAIESEDESIRTYFLQTLCERVATCPRDEDTASKLFSRFERNDVQLLNILVHISRSDNFLKSNTLRKRLANFSDRVCKIMSDAKEKRVVESCVIFCRSLAQHSSTANVLFKTGCVRCLVVLTKTCSGSSDVMDALLLCAANNTETRAFLSRVPNFYDRVTASSSKDENVLWAIVLSTSRSDLVEESKKLVKECVLSQIMYDEDEDMKRFVSKRASAERLLRRFVLNRHVLTQWPAYEWLCETLCMTDADLRQVTTKLLNDERSSVPKELREKNAATVRRLQIIIRTVKHLSTKSD